MRTAEAVAGMLCPVCKVGLHMSDRQGIEIDYCPQCRGIWLDRGELDKIIERSAAAEPPAQPVPPPAPQAPQPPQPPQGGPWGGGYPQQGYDRGYDDRGGYGHNPHYYKHKRKKSFLEDLFD